MITPNHLTDNPHPIAGEPSKRKRKPAFTPGPWEIWTEHPEVVAGPTSENTPSCVRGHRGTICAVDDLDFPEREQKANAQLIAAAPNLYAACEKAESIISEMLGRRNCEAGEWDGQPIRACSHCRIAAELSEIRAALAKASGKEATR